MKVIVGLGNPGREYEKTRHNVGFVLLDHLAQRYGVKIDTKKHKSLYTDEWIKNEKTVMVKPQTYMNDSGVAAQQISAFYDLRRDDMLVVYDDFHLDIDRIRFRQNGSAGGHNGIKSMLQHCGEDGFSRMRIGVGPKTIPDTSSFVLGKFSDKDIDLIESRKDSWCDMIEYWVANGIEKTMNEYNPAEKNTGKN